MRLIHELHLSGARVPFLTIADPFNLESGCGRPIYPVDSSLPDKVSEFDPRLVPTVAMEVNSSPRSPPSLIQQAQLFMLGQRQGKINH